MATEIRNVSVDPVTLPYPLQGTLDGGQAIVLTTACATLLALIPSLSRSFQVTDLGASYSGENHDAEFGLSTSEVEALTNKTLTTCTLGSALACGGYDLSSAGVITGKRATLAPTAVTSGVPPSALQVTPAADTGITAGTEAVGVSFSQPASRQWATGALAMQREYVFSAPTYRFVAASTLTNAVTLWVEGAPVEGTNATFTNSYAIYVAGGRVYLAGDLAVMGGLSMGQTNTTGTPGAAVINSPTGKVAVAIGQSSVTVTNGMVSANSIVIAVLEFIDATFTQILSVVPGAGSFVITGNAAATAATQISFVVINPL